MDLTNWVMVAAPNEWPANIIFPASWTSITFLNADSEVEEVLRLLISSPRSSFIMLS